MTAPIIDRDAIIEKAARAYTADVCRRDAWDELTEESRAVGRRHIAAAASVILDVTLTLIEAIRPEVAYNYETKEREDVIPASRLAQAVAAIREAVRA